MRTSARQHLFGNNCSSGRELDSIQQLSPRLTANTAYNTHCHAEVDFDNNVSLERQSSDNSCCAPCSSDNTHFSLDNNSDNTSADSVLHKPQEFFYDDPSSDQDIDELSDSDNECMSDQSVEFSDDSSAESFLQSEAGSELSDPELSDDEVISDDEDKNVYSQIELNALCFVSYFLRHNSSGIAIKDLLNLLQVLCPESSQFKDITYDKIMSLAGNTNCKVVDYCHICNRAFPEDPDVFRCETNRCTGLRYKGEVTAQQKAGRQTRNSFVLADVEKQLQFILERKGVWSSIQNTKCRISQSGACTEVTDISDGQFYRSLCRPGHFLSNPNTVSALFNTDGIPLYNSSNVKLWPVFLAINELPPSCRFARENMILAAIWQGKDKPPFHQYMCAFGEQMSKLYEIGVQVKPFNSAEVLNVRLGVFVATMDLQAELCSEYDNA